MELNKNIPKCFPFDSNYFACLFEQNTVRNVKQLLFNDYPQREFIEFTETYIIICSSLLGIRLLGWCKLYVSNK